MTLCYFYVKITQMCYMFLYVYLGYLDLQPRQKQLLKNVTNSAFKMVVEPISPIYYRIGYIRPTNSATKNDTSGS